MMVAELLEYLRWDAEVAKPELRLVPRQILHLNCGDWFRHGHACRH